jgi:uncharacterized membrane protein SpoIIM required for sporulation
MNSAGETNPPAARFTLKSAQFRREREPSWRELEALLERAESRGLESLAHDEVNRLPTLYRGVLGSLSVARAISLDRNLLDYLTNLAARAYLVVYAGRRRPREAVIDFVSGRFPRIVRGFGAFLGLALFCLAAGVLCGFLLTREDPERYRSFVAPALAHGRTFEAPTDSLRAVLYRSPGSGDVLHLFATFLFSHNATIGMLCLALGFAAGFPVAFLLFQNGIMLGAMAALYASRGLGIEFWAWVLPHGVTELLAIALCGMAGFVFGAAIIFPGERSRLENLSRRGRDAGLAVLGAVGLFFVAALFEGFFRSLVKDVPARWTVAIAMLVLWTLYFGFVGRGHGHAGRDAS